MSASNPVGASNMPAEEAEAVTPSDTVSLTTRCRALYIGVSGDVALLVNQGSTIVTFKAVPVGILPVRCYRVNSTNTTATNIVALF